MKFDAILKNTEEQKEYLYAVEVLLNLLTRSKFVKETKCSSAEYLISPSD